MNDARLRLIGYRCERKNSENLTRTPKDIIRSLILQLVEQTDDDLNSLSLDLANPNTEDLDVLCNLFREVLRRSRRTAWFCFIDESSFLEEGDCAYDYERVLQTLMGELTWTSTRSEKSFNLLFTDSRRCTTIRELLLSEDCVFVAPGTVVSSSSRIERGRFQEKIDTFR